MSSLFPPEHVYWLKVKVTLRSNMHLGKDFGGQRCFNFYKILICFNFYKILV